MKTLKGKQDLLFIYLLKNRKRTYRKYGPH